MRSSLVNSICCDRRSLSMVKPLHSTAQITARLRKTDQTRFGQYLAERNQLVAVCECREFRPLVQRARLIVRQLVDERLPFKFKDPGGKLVPNREQEYGRWRCHFADQKIRCSQATPRAQRI